MGYQWTEVGVIPADWQVSNLVDITDRVTVGLATSVTKYYRDKGVPIVRNLNIKDGYFDGGDMLYIDEKFAKANATKAAKAFDVITVHTGANLGQTCVLPVEFDNCQTFTTLITTPCKTVLCSYFLSYLMSSAYGRSELARLEVGGGKGNLNTADLKKFRVPHPSTKAEQEAIAKALNDTDALIESLEQLITKKRNIKQGAMQELLTGKRRLPGFSGEWESKSISEVSDIDPENLSSNTNPEYRFNYISLEQVDRGTLLGFTEEEFLTSPSRARRVLRFGDVLMATVRPSLMAHLLYREQIPNAVCSTGFAVLRAKYEIAIPGFIFEHLFCYVVNKQIEKIIAGSNYPAINSSELQQIEIPCPPTFEEQIEIVDVLNDMELEIRTLEKKLVKTQKLKQGVMHELLTGSIRLVKPRKKDNVGY